MNEQEMKEQAERLAQSVTPYGRLWWLETWKTVDPSHPQHGLKADQMGIGHLALEIRS